MSVPRLTKRKGRKMHAGDRVFIVCNYVLLGLLTLLFIIPLWSTLMTSFIGEAERLRRGMFIFWPEQLDFSAYQSILRKNSPVFTGYAVTLTRTIAGTFLNMLVTTMLAYGLAKRTLPLRVPLTFLIYFTMLFSGGLVPTYLVVKHTGLYNSVGALIVPSLVSVWNLLLMRNFFMQIPESLEEAAIIDGASPPVILFRIVLPLSISSLVTIALFYAVWHWNSWFDGLIYISDRRMQPLQMVLRDIIIASSTETMFEFTSEAPPPLETVKGATIVVSTLPILMVYPFIQKYFIKGVMVGGVKG